MTMSREQSDEQAKVYGRIVAKAWSDDAFRQRLLANPDRRADLIDAGRRHAAGFTWQATAAGLARLYLRLANSS